MKSTSGSGVTDLRRAQLVQAAYEMISQKGYFNFTVRDIARAAGLSTGLVHYYFRNKEDLLLTLFKNMQANVQQYLREALDRSSDPVERLNIFLDQAFSLPEREGDYIYLLFDFWSQIKHNEKVRKVNRRLMRSFRDELAGIIRAGVEQGAFAAGDVDRTAAAVIALVQGIMVQHVSDPEAFNYPELASELKSKILEMLQVRPE